MALIDTHRHAYVCAFDADRDAVLRQAFDAGVDRLLTNIDADSVDSLLALSQAYPNRCLPMMGLHPCHVDDDLGPIAFPSSRRSTPTPVSRWERLAWTSSRAADPGAPDRAFHAQVGWALDQDLPVVLHVREAFEDTFAVLDQYTDTALRGVFHCFTGRLRRSGEGGRIRFVLASDWAALTTFKNGGLDQVVPHLPQDRILLETDSPYLAPVPHRGKRNEPAYTALVAQRVADLLERLAEITALTTANAERLFRLPAFTPTPPDAQPHPARLHRGHHRFRGGSGHGGLKPLNFDHLRNRVPEVDALEVELDFESLAPIDSGDMTPDR